MEVEIRSVEKEKKKGSTCMRNFIKIQFEPSAVTNVVYFVNVEKQWNGERHKLIKPLKH
jgi:hypothetical protein